MAARGAKIRPSAAHVPGRAYARISTSHVFFSVRVCVLVFFCSFALLHIGLLACFFLQNTLTLVLYTGIREHLVL